MVIFYKKYKKCNEIKLTKNKMASNIRKMTNQPPSPGHEPTNKDNPTRKTWQHEWIETTKIYTS